MRHSIQARYYTGLRLGFQQIALSLVYLDDVGELFMSSRQKRALILFCQQFHVHP